MRPEVHRVRWWKSDRARFLAAFLLAGGGVVAIGWTTDVRDVMHAGLLAFAVVALLPFIVIAAGLALAVAISTVSAMVGDGAAVELGAASVQHGGKLVGPYYRGWRRIHRRHPGAAGALLGTVGGALALWAMIALLVVPGETETVDTLLGARRAIARHEAATGRLPAPVDGRLVLDGAVVRDGFGNALEYRVHGRWKLRTWSLTSRGYDGVAGSDDLCVTGSTKLLAMIEREVGIADLDERLDAVRRLACP